MIVVSIFCSRLLSLETHCLVVDYFKGLDKDSNTTFQMTQTYMTALT